MKKNLLNDSLVALSRIKEFKPLIKKYSEPKLRRGKNSFQSLSRSIIYQQISGKAAASIYRRFVGLFGIKLTGDFDWEKPKNRVFPTPAQVLATPDEKMRSAGLSTSKVVYIKDLAQHYVDGLITDVMLPKMATDEIVTHLTRVKGIGEWTVHMFLIFTLNRPDVLPTGDLAIRKGFQTLYDLPELPSHKEMEILATKWRAHASTASWYLWRLSDEAKPLPRLKSPLKKSPRRG